MNEEEDVVYHVFSNEDFELISLSVIIICYWRGICMREVWEIVALDLHAHGKHEISLISNCADRLTCELEVKMQMSIRNGDVRWDTEDYLVYQWNKLVL